MGNDEKQCMKINRVPMKNDINLFAVRTNPFHTLRAVNGLWFISD